MLRNTGLIVVMTLFMAVSFYGQAEASKPRLLGTFGDWQAYSFTENGNKVCYMASKPKTDVGNYTSRGDIFALITHRPAEKSKDVFSYISGYPYKAGSQVTIQVNGGTHKLFTQDETAWAADAAADRSLVNGIKGGSKMIVKGTSKRGTLTTDTFSLNGSSKAYRTISQTCGL